MEIGKLLASVLKHKHVVFNPASANALVIQPGLYGDNFAAFQRVFSKTQTRLFVDFQADSVPRRVEKSAPAVAVKICFVAVFFKER